MGHSKHDTWRLREAWAYEQMNFKHGEVLPDGHTIILTLTLQQQSCRTPQIAKSCSP